MTPVYRADDGELLKSALAGEGVHLEPAAILDGLTDTDAQTRTHGLPYSVAEVVAHLCHWQEWFNGCVRSGFTGIAQHSVDGWPAVAPGQWDALRSRYLESIEEGKRIATDAKSLGDALIPAGQVPSLARESHGSALLRAALHNSHHLGQIVTMRRLLGLWPPPGGTITW